MAALAAVLEDADPAELPLTGAGRTRAQWELLATLGARSLAAARVLEPHLDALSILAQADVPAPSGLLGVYASESGGVTPTATRLTGHDDGAADNADDDGPDDEEARKRAQDEADKRLIKIEKEELVRGYKYGASFAPAPEGGFPKLKTQKGMDICGFFSRKNFRRELSMGEVYYVWAGPENPMSQVALSSIVQAMYEKGVMAIARWVSRDNMDPKMGVLYPSVFDEVDCFLWVQVSSWYPAVELSRDR